MRQTVIENPILNSPFLEPTCHFRFDAEGITNDVVAGRRSSSYFMPIPAPRKKGAQLSCDTEWTKDRIEKNKHVKVARKYDDAWIGPAASGGARYQRNREPLGGEG